jgi:hypothetical protein
MPTIHLQPEDLRLVALRMLQGVGDADLGEWAEYTGVAYHLRRRLAPHEQARVGEAVDLRGTPEARRRYDRATPLQQKLASQELGI